MALFKAMEHTNDAVEISSVEPDRPGYVEVRDTVVNVRYVLYCNCILVLNHVLCW